MRSGPRTDAASGPPARASEKKSERASTTAWAEPAAGYSVMEMAIAVPMASVPAIWVGGGVAPIVNAALVALVSDGDVATSVYPLPPALNTQPVKVATPATSATVNVEVQ